MINTTDDVSLAAPHRTRRGRWRRSSRGASATRVWQAQLGLGALIVVAPHLIPGVHAWSTVLLAIGACAALGLSLWMTRDENALVNDPLLAVLLLMVGVTMLHALPLPDAVAAQFAATSRAETLEIAKALGMPPPHWFPFTSSPADTWERVLYGVAVLASYASARLIYAASEGRSRLLVAVALSALGVAISSIAHEVVGARSVYGTYHPRYVPANGPILNANNLAGMLALALPICIALAVRSRSAKRYLWLIASSVVAARGLLAGSRGGLLVIVGGSALFATLFWLRVRQRGERESDAPRREVRLIAIVGGLLVAMSIGLASLTGHDYLDVSYQDLTKFDMFRRYLGPLLQDPIVATFGVGRGSFRTVVSAWLGGSFRAMYAENLFLQYAVEFGLPLSVLFLGAICIRVVRGMLASASTIQLGGAAGLAAILLQNMVDFSLELTGVAIPAAACLGSLATPAYRAVSLKKWSQVSLGVGVFACLVFSASAARNDVLSTERELEDLARRGDRPAFWLRLKRSILANPSEPSLSLLASHMKLLENTNDATYWFGRTMRLAPGWALPHLQAASWLAARGRWAQAADELSSAAELDARSLQQNLCEWLRARPSAEFVLAFAPSSELARVDTLDRAAECLRPLDIAQSQLLDAQILRIRPHHLAAQLRRAQHALERGDFADAIAYAIEARTRAPLSGVAAEVHALALLSWGQPRDAMALLEPLVGRTDDPRRVLLALAEAQAAAREADGMRATMEQLRLLAAGDAPKLADVAIRLAQYEAILHNDARALAATMEAYRISGQGHHLANAATLATKLGQLDFALRAWSELCERYPDDARYCEKRDQLRPAIEP